MQIRSLLITACLIICLCASVHAQMATQIEPLRSVDALPSSVRAGSSNPNAQLIAVASQDGTIKVYDAQNLSEVASFAGGQFPLTSLLFSRQDRLLYASKVSGQVDLWDISKKQKVKELNISRVAILGIAELPMQRLLVAEIDRNVELFDVGAGKKLSSPGSLPEDISAVLADSSGTNVLVVSENGKVRLLGVPALNDLKISDTQGLVSRAALSPDGKWLALGSPLGIVRLWDVAASTVRCSFDESKKATTTLAFDPQSHWLLAASSDSTARCYDLSKFALAKSFSVQEGYVTAASFLSPETFWTGTSKGTVKIWKIRQTPLDTIPPMIVFSEPTEPRKVYGATVQLKGLVWDKSKIKEVLVDEGAGGLHLAEPPDRDLVAGMTTKSFVLDGKLDKPGENAFSIKAVDEFGNVGRSTLTIQKLSSEEAIEVTNPPKNFEAEKVSVKLEFKVWGDVASYQVMVNVVEAAQNRFVKPRAAGSMFSEEIPLVGGYNQVQINVVLSSGEKLSRTLGINRKIYGAVVAAAPVTVQTTKERGVEPQLWAVVVGISEYENKAIPPLHFADADAGAFADFLRKPEGGGFQPDHMRVLINKEATLANVKIAFVEFLSQAIDKDLVMIFFAGHGAPDPARPANLFFLTHDTDPSRLGTTAYPMWDMRTLLERQLSAKRIVVFSDACHSGGISSDFATRGVNTTSSNLINQYLADLARTKEGIVMFTASAAGEVSQELPDLGHGVFTYYLLEGMRGEADLNNDYTVTINELMQYVEDQVKRKTKGAQNPTRSQTMYDKDLTISKIAH
jgi:uncharacterized caspase-like protein